jgi:hypothetical protein
MPYLICSLRNHPIHLRQLVQAGSTCYTEKGKTTREVRKIDIVYAIAERPEHKEQE